MIEREKEEEEEERERKATGERTGYTTLVMTRCLVITCTTFYM
jgi:hypothetical protein